MQQRIQLLWYTVDPWAEKSSLENLRQSGYTTFVGPLYGVLAFLPSHTRISEAALECKFCLGFCFSSTDSTCHTATPQARLNRKLSLNGAIQKENRHIISDVF